jgi:exopolysaccharide biosynthesis polyprenyl glycosylphosphotransferase
MATALLTAFLYLVGDDSISRLVIGFGGLMNVTTLAAWRIWKRQLIEQRVAKGIGARNVLIVGAGRVGQALACYLDQNKHLGYVVKGFLDGNHHGDPRMLGRIEDLCNIARGHYADEVFITIPSERALVKQVALAAREQRLEVKVVPDLYDGLGWNAPIRFVGDYPVMELHREPITALGLFAKRLIDIVGSGLALILLFPAYAALALLIRWDSPGPAIYRSRRIGKKGREFTCYKFRTMVANADALKEELRGQNQRNGPFFKMAADPRITRMGRILRKYSLDELPQFWNVLKGDMSLVGPRPHPLDDYQRYSLEHRRRLDVKPGITGLWQVTARRDPSFETNMALDLQYIERWTLGLDFLILLRTAAVVLRGNGQ